MIGAIYRAITLGTLDWKVAGTVNPSNNTVSISEADNFGDLYAMDNTTSRLPIVLLSFASMLDNDSVKINWTTLSEVDNDFFTIERSSDGVTFEPIAYIRGRGTSYKTNDYSVSDDQPLSGRNYYRLKQTDFNGQFEYSEIVSVDYQGEPEFDFRLASNPSLVGQEVHIWKTNGVEGIIPNLYIRDINGQLVYSAQLDNSDQNEVRLGGSGKLSAGIYFVTVKYFGYTQTRKLMIR